MMRRPSKSSGRGQSSRTLSISAPVSGWNARDPIAEMSGTDAVILDNFFCTPFNVQVRRGAQLWASGTSAVNTLASYSPQAAPIKLFAASGANIYDATAQGAVGAPVVAGQTSDKWQHVNFGTPAGTFLVMVNGQDKMQQFNGTTWTAIDGASTPAVTGVATTALISVNAFKSRLWFVEKNSMKAWYLPVISIGGAATSVDFSALFTNGGYLMAMATWSLDAGRGMDDHAVFISSEGQVAVFSGTDPASATTWSLIGVFTIGSPIGRRCYMDLGGDVTIICEDGLAPLSASLMSVTVNNKEMITDKIQHVISEYVTNFGSVQGWETQLYPRENMLIINIPLSTSESVQVAMNTISGAWSRFLGWNARTFELHGDQLFYGGQNGIYKAYYGETDFGNNINFEALQSFNYFGTKTQLKHVKMARPIIMTNGSPSFALGINVDFDTAAPMGNPTFAPIPYGIWDSATWDNSFWGGGDQVKRDWQSVFGLGYCFAAHIKGAASNINISWNSTDYVLENGGVI
jgi:hypothetical protein